MRGIRRPALRPRTAAFIFTTLLAGLATVSAPALANGGIVRIAAQALGPWFVTVYSSPTPLRTGEVDISVLVQDSADAILDVPITVEAQALDSVADLIRASADRRQATNKLFKAAKFDVDVPGRWEFRVRIGSAVGAGAEPAAGAEPGEAAGPGGVVSFQAVVARSTILDRPFLLAALVLLPLLVAGWFLLGRPTGPTD